MFFGGRLHTDVPYIYRVTLGQKAWFLGLGLSVPKAEDLERLSRAFGARIEQADGPGGGAAVHLRARRHRG